MKQQITSLINNELTTTMNAFRIRRTHLNIIKYPLY